MQKVIVDISKNVSLNSTSLVSGLPSSNKVSSSSSFFHMVLVTAQAGKTSVFSNLLSSYLGSLETILGPL